MLPILLASRQTDQNGHQKCIPLPVRPRALIIRDWHVQAQAEPNSCCLRLSDKQDQKEKPDLALNPRGAHRVLRSLHPYLRQIAMPDPIERQ